VRLLPPAYVKPYVKRQKNDAADAEAICERVTRADMRFAPAKTPEQQSRLMLHRTRHRLIRQQTSVINGIRAHPAEFGVTAPVGREGIEEPLCLIADPSDKRLPDVVRKDGHPISSFDQQKYALVLGCTSIVERISAAGIHRTSLCCESSFNVGRCASSSWYARTT